MSNRVTADIAQIENMQEDPGDIFNKVEIDADKLEEGILQFSLFGVATE